LEENSNFYVFNDSLVDVDAKELNVVLSFSGQTNINEDDDDDIHIENCDGFDDYSINDKEEEILSNYQNKGKCKAFFFIM
jgi:hypothetical protein